MIKYYLELLDEGEEDFEAKGVTGSEFLIVYKLEEIDVINKHSEINEEVFSKGSSRYQLEHPTGIWKIMGLTPGEGFRNYFFLRIVLENASSFISLCSSHH